MRRHRSHERGFTLVEVMVSIGVMTIGAMALIAMQQQTVRGNVHARELTIATQIAQTWIERLKLDGMRWVNVSGVPATDLVNTEFLFEVTRNGREGAFTTIPVTGTHLGPTVGMSNGFDYFGRDQLDMTNGMGLVRYCASMRLSWVYWDRLKISDDRALRADVRVWWAKEISVTAKNTANTLAVDFPNCVDNNVLLNPGAGGLQYNNYHTVYLSTVIRPAGR